jgi:hypothetical protein
MSPCLCLHIARLTKACIQVDDSRWMVELTWPLGSSCGHTSGVVALAVYQSELSFFVVSFAHCTLGHYHGSGTQSGPFLHPVFVILILIE